MSEALRRCRRAADRGLAIWARWLSAITQERELRTSGESRYPHHPGTHLDDGGGRVAPSTDPPLRERNLDLADHPHLDRAYRAAADALESGQWTAAGVLVGRTLEALLSDVLTDAGEEVPSNASLGALTQAIVNSERIDLGRPISLVADALRRGRNLGAHFNLGHDLDRSTAEELVELIEMMIEYLKVLPQRVAQLVEQLNGRPQVAEHRAPERWEERVIASGLTGACRVQRGVEVVVRVVHRAVYRPPLRPG